MNKRVWLICLIVCVIVLFGSFALPQSLGNTPAMIGGIALVLIPIFVIAFIVSGIKEKRKPKLDLSQAATLSSQDKPAPVTAQVPVQSVTIPTPTPEPVQPATVSPTSSAEKKAMKVERVHVRGIEHYTDNVKAVAWENPDYDLAKREMIEQCPDEKVWQYSFNVKGDLAPEPDNEYDPNAIMVQANGLCIGHVPKGSTAHIRKLMESGRIKSMNLSIGGGKYKEVYETDDGEYEMDRGERNYSAVLELYLTDED